MAFLQKLRQKVKKCLLQDSDGPVSSPLSGFYGNGNAPSPLNPRLVDGLATLMSSGSGNLENIAFNPASTVRTSKETLTTVSSSVSSRTVLANISNRMSANPENVKPGQLSGNGSVRLVRGDATARSASKKDSSPKHTPKRAPLSRLNQRSENVFKPPSHSKKIKLRDSWSRFREQVNSSTPKESKSRMPQPFPALRFADKTELWNVMCKKESGMYLRLPDCLTGDRHPNLQPRMRAILVDWLIEVSEVYKLHRETLYLSVDFLDRYLSHAKADLARSQLQLVGITCLFIASKIEEIYPPKLREFSFVTDGACEEHEIVQMELVVIKGLQWGLSPQTPNRWLKTYMQINSLNTKDTQKEEESGTNFVKTRFNQVDYLRAMQLLDLVTLDSESLRFRYSVLAAAVIYHCHDEQSALQASGYTWDDIRSCVEWMCPYVSALTETVAVPTLRSFTEVQPEDFHNIQTHTVELTVLEDAQAKQAEMREKEDLAHVGSPFTAAEETDSDSEELNQLAQAALMTPPTPSTAPLRHAHSHAHKSEGKSDAKIRHPHQQSSVFLSPTSEAENSGIW